jgi:hypothetical protein
LHLIVFIVNLFFGTDINTQVSQPHTYTRREQWCPGAQNPLSEVSAATTTVYGLAGILLSLRFTTFVG